MYNQRSGTFADQLKLCKRVMELDYGTDKNEVNDKIALCYWCWPKVSCPICQEQVYTATGMDLLIRCCCGTRIHANCFKEDIDLDQAIPPCISSQCVDCGRVPEFENSFLYLSHNRECIGAFSGGNLEELRTFIDLNTEYGNRSRNESVDRWRPFPYLNDRNLPFKECQEVTSGKRKLDTNNSPVAQNSPGSQKSPICNSKRRRTTGTALEAANSSNSNSKLAARSNAGAVNSHATANVAKLSDSANFAIGSSLAKSLNSQQPFRRQAEAPVNPTAQKFTCNEFDVASGLYKPSTFFDIKLHDFFSFRIETDMNDPNMSYEHVKNVLQSVLMMVETPLVHNCSKCTATFDSINAFEQHNSIAQLFDGICQPVPVRERKFSGPAMFFIPYFAWQFLEKVGNDLSHSIFYLDRAEMSPRSFTWRPILPTCLTSFLHGSVM